MNRSEVRQVRQCKHCGRSARRRIIHGEDKGYYRTCGSVECLAAGRPAQTRQCKHCDRPAKLNIVNGRNKGFLRTCGSQECLTARYRDKEVNDRKRPPRVLGCSLCNSSFVARAARQKWCFDCVPDQKWRHIARRYGIGKPQWEQLLQEQGGTCALCDDEPKVVDHDHENDKVRGLLCYSCNLLIAGLDADIDWVARALAYREKEREEE